MESILSAIWKQQTTSAKMFRKMPEVLPIQNHIHLITSSMVHLVHQMQYYFLFEVNGMEFILSKASPLNSVFTIKIALLNVYVFLLCTYALR